MRLSEGRRCLRGRAYTLVVLVRLLGASACILLRGDLLFDRLAVLIRMRVARLGVLGVLPDLVPLDIRLDLDDLLLVLHVVFLELLVLFGYLLRISLLGGRVPLRLRMRFAHRLGLTRFSLAREGERW